MSTVIGNWCAVCHRAFPFGRLSRGARARTACLAAFVAPLTSLAAQTIAVEVGDSARLRVAPGATVGIPLRVDLANAGPTLNLASVTGTLAWGAGRLTFDSLRANAATGFTQTANTAGAAAGSLTVGYLGTSRLPASGALATAWFTAGATAGGTRVAFTATDAGTEDGTRVLAALRVRALELCVVAQWRWGDVNDDGGVSIIDAQQIARFSVGLSAAARVNTSATVLPTVASVALTPGAAPAVAVGGTVALAAEPRDSTGGSLAGCQAVTWSSSATAVATVSAEGVVTGVSAGSATITAEAGGRTATVAVTVQPPLALVVGVAPVGGVSSTLLPTQPVLEVRDHANARVTASRLVTASLAAGSGTLSGTRTVATVDGVATFTDLGITGTGAHTLRFSSDGVAAVTAPAVTLAVPATMRLLVGEAPTLAGTAGTEVVIPLVADLSGRGSQNLASLTTTVTWDTTRLTYVGNAAGTWEGASVTVNAGGVTGGTLTLSLLANEGATTTRTVRTLTLRPRVTGPVAVNATVGAAGNELGQSVGLGVRPLGLAGSTVPVASVVVTPATATVAVGGTQPLTASVRDAAGNVLVGRAVTWTSSDTTRATVSASGVVTGRAAGSATITASSEGRSGTAAVTVQGGLLSLGQKVTGLSSSAGEQLFQVSVPAGTSVLTVRTFGGSGSVRLQLYQGATPAGSAVCTSNNSSSTSQLCAVAAPAADTWTVRVQEYVSAFSNVTLEINPAIPAVSLGQSVFGLDSREGDAVHHVTVPAGTSSLTVRTSGGSGSVRLLLYQGAMPSGSAVCTSNNSSSTSQLCSVAAPAAGTWTVRVQEYVSAFSNVTLEINPTIPALSLGQSATGLSSNQGDAVRNVTVPAGTSSLMVRTSGGSGSVRLLLYQGATPGGSAVCSSNNSTSTSQLCAVAAPAAGTWTVRVQEYVSAFSAVTLGVNPFIPTLALGETATGLSSSGGDAVYHVNVPAGTSGLTVRTSGGSGSVRLLLYQGATPAGSTVCTSNSGNSTNQLCAVATPTAGTWTVRIQEYVSSFSNVSVTVTSP